MCWREEPSETTTVGNRLSAMMERGEVSLVLAVWKFAVGESTVKKLVCLNISIRERAERKGSVLRM